MAKPYTISENSQGHFVLSNDKTVHNVCPCCDKPIFTREAALALKHNLEILDRKIEAENGSFY